jgi:hypothetical protein
VDHVERLPDRTELRVAGVAQRQHAEGEAVEARRGIGHQLAIGPHRAGGRLAAKRAYDRADLDLDFEKPAAEWIKGTLKALAPAEAPADNVVAVDFRAGTEDEDGEVSREPAVVEVIDHVNLNSSRSVSGKISSESPGS